jgi:hypothetical protein
MERHEGERRLPLLPSLLIAAALLAAFVIDFFLVPWSYVAASLYAIPILIAARRFSPRTIAGVGLLAISLNFLSPRTIADVGLLAISLNFLSIYLEQTPPGGWLVGLLSLPLITYDGFRWGR